MLKLYRLLLLYNIMTIINAYLYLFNEKFCSSFNGHIYNFLYIYAVFKITVKNTEDIKVILSIYSLSTCNGYEVMTNENLEFSVNTSGVRK